MTEYKNTKWMGEYRSLVEEIIRLCNESSTKFCKPANFNTPILLSAHEIQIIEYILENKDEKMSVIAKRLGITRGAFSNNVTKLIEMGCLKKELREGNKKDKYVVVTDYGEKIYETYVNFIYKRTFEELFRLADTIPKEHIETFCKMLNVFSETLV